MLYNFDLYLVSAAALELFGAAGCFIANHNRQGVILIFLCLLTLCLCLLTQP